MKFSQSMSIVLLAAAACAIAAPLRARTVDLSNRNEADTDLPVAAYLLVLDYKDPVADKVKRGEESESTADADTILLPSYLIYIIKSVWTRWIK